MHPFKLRLLFQVVADEFTQAARGLIFLGLLRLVDLIGGLLQVPAA